MPAASRITPVPPVARDAAPRRRPRAKSPLEVIPGIGPSIAADLNRIGIHEVAELKGESPQRLYDDLCAHDDVKHDRCVLYAFRCAVYYASRRKHDPEKLKWWNWADR
ncbi:MAG: TfoX/Sxy family DNA transformation protein [Betaproteobacteria bacterium]|nr:TfoX/Sxy family DNA transformation protein [Betaproteobacteria bacterium]